MQEKVLFVSNTANFSKFNICFMKWFRERGFRVDYASAGEEDVLECDNHFKICFSRSPYSLNNIIAYRQLKNLIDCENYSLIHCHTPVAGAIARLAAKKFRDNEHKLLYTAHGFHFYKGAPIKNWLLFYPIEKYLSKYTDCLITINDEDYNCALNKGFMAGEIVKADGVGVDIHKFKPIPYLNKLELRKKYGFTDDNFILLYVAEFTKEKNHEFIIKSLPDIKKNIPNLKVLFAGTGVKLNNCKKLVKRLGLNKEVCFLGYRKDINLLQQLSNIALSSSMREGLPINIVEAMASGLPIVCSKIRGHTDLIRHRDNGYLFSLNDKESLENHIFSLYYNEELRESMGRKNILLANKYSMDKALENMVKIYDTYSENSHLAKSLICQGI